MANTIEQNKQIGREGGNVPTHNMPWQKANDTDKAVNDGKRSTNR